MVGSDGNKILNSTVMRGIDEAKGHKKRLSSFVYEVESASK